MNAIKLFDATITKLIVSLPESWRSVFLFITYLGDPILTIGIGLIVALWGYTITNFRLLLAGISVWLTLGIGSLIKLLIGRERPLSEYSANLRIDTFSFPSGHSSGAMIAYGLLAYVAWHILPQPWNIVTVIVCGIIIASVGISRVYLGAHFPSDVIAGWLLGAIFLLLVIFVLRPLP